MVRERSAKPLCAGSIPARASNIFNNYSSHSFEFVQTNRAPPTSVRRTSRKRFVDHLQSVDQASCNTCHMLLPRVSPVEAALRSARAYSSFLVRPRPLPYQFVASLLVQNLRALQWASQYWLVQRWQDHGAAKVDGWQVCKDRVERMRSREALKVPASSRSHSGFGAAADSARIR